MMMVPDEPVWRTRLVMVPLNGEGIRTGLERSCWTWAGLPPGGLSACSRGVFERHSWGRGAAGIQWVEVLQCTGQAPCP